MYSLSFLLSNTYPPMIITTPIIKIGLSSLSIPYAMNAAPMRQIKILNGILLKLDAMNFRNINNRSLLLIRIKPTTTPKKGSLKFDTERVSDYLSFTAKTPRTQSFFSFLFTGERKGNKNQKPYGRITILLEYMLVIALPWFFVSSKRNSFSFLPSQQKRKYVFSANFAALAKRAVKNMLSFSCIA